MTNPRVLFAPLNWGLGHASRCVPIIHEFLRRGAEVVIAADKDCLLLLKKEFPAVIFIVLEGYQVSYPINKNLTFHFLFEMPKMMRQIKKEHLQLKKIVDDHRIDVVISDNRYGLYSEKIPSVLITHQVNPPITIARRLIKILVNRLINRFDQCWIPDIEGHENFAGSMSSPTNLQLPISYIGPLSRFKYAPSEFQFDILAILSGPEPQRTLFEKKIILQMNAIQGRHILIRGTSEKIDLDNAPQEHIIVYDLLDGKLIDKKINSSRYIVSRSGYSSIMDYLIKGRNALLVPTPGQAEQEYLAFHHRQKNKFVVQFQSSLDLNSGIESIKLKPNFEPIESGPNLNKIIDDLLEALY